MIHLIARYWRALAWVLAVLVSSTAGAATPSGTTITNTVQASWSAGGTTATVSAQRQITVSPYTLGSDLAINMTGPGQIVPGSTIVWKAVVTDVGPSAANGAQVALTVPPGVTNISGVCVVLTTGACGAVTVGTPTAAGTPVTITLPSFPVDGRVEITLRGTAPAVAGPITQLAVVSIPGSIDPTPANNLAAVQTQVLAAAPNTGSLSGRVWLDVNHDRVRNPGEFLFEGFTVRVYDAAGATVVRQVATDATGTYLVAGLPAGITYQVEFRDRGGNVVFGLPVTAESSGANAAFAATATCASLAETRTPNIVTPNLAGNCYSLTAGGSTAQVQRSGRISVALQAGDNVIEQSLPLDPSGVVYDSVTRAPVAGATVTFNGPPGYDPALHLLGGAANQSQVTGPDGFYQFLLVGGAPAGNYTLTVTPPAGYRAPSTQIPASGLLDPTGLGVGGTYLVQAQSGPPPVGQPTIYHLAFALAIGDPNVINNHIPIDPSGVPGTALTLTKTAGKSVAAIGDFVQYVLSLSNPGAGPVNAVTVTDRLPPGFRYRSGTARANGVSVQPAVSADARTLTFNLGVLAATASVEIKYVVEITAGATPGNAVNIAQAAGAGGAASLAARATVNVKEDLFRSRTILMGRVIEVGASGPKVAQAGAGDVPPVASSEAGLCNAEQFFGKGIENARVFMEDGTYVRTDKDGKWHIEGVKPGTHVVQLDKKSLPEGYEVVLCEDNTRHAGRAFSQFVNVRGGTMWRADFYVRRTGFSNAYEAGHQLRVTRGSDGARVRLELKGVTAQARNISATLALPEGAAYALGSARMSNAAMAEPEINGNMVVFRVGDASGTWNKVIEFDVKGKLPVGASVQAMTQFQSTDGQTRRPAPVEVILESASNTRARISKAETIQYRQTVDSSSAVPAGAAPAANADKPASQPAAAQPSVEKLNIYAPGSEQFDSAWLATASQELEIVYPAENFIPGINATKVFVKHHPSLKVSITMNGVPVNALAYDGMEHNSTRTAALSRWGGIGIGDGVNKIVAVAKDETGREVARAERSVYYSGSGAEGRFVPEASTLLADGRTAPVIAVRIFDRNGKPVRHGTEGDLHIGAPYQQLEVVQRRDSRPLLDAINNKAAWRVTDDGIALIRLQPTVTSGEVVLTFNFEGRAPQVIRAWLKPELREWILVSLGEGTIGQRKLSGAIENLPRGEADEKLWKDGRVAFYAKGRVKGDFLVTLAYDSDKERRRLGGNQGDRLLQGIDRKQYYTLYGDTTSAQHDAASTRKLYLRIEKNQFYALFGDFDTGMSVTELSRYSRTLNGVKSEFRGQNVSFTAFATRTAQAFVKDELRPDGTSGYYRLTRANILPNSDKVVIETRDRFRNEVIVKSEPQSRGIDYDIDYTLGTIIFRKAVTGKDQNFNPTYIIVDYESEDPSRDERMTAGGRVAVRTSDGKAEIGVSAVHEGTRGARADLRGADATVQLDAKTRLRAEIAQTSREVAGVTGNVSGSAYLVEARRQDTNVAASAYVRGQQGEFGLGQQAAAQSGTTKMGADVAVKVSPQVTVNAQAAHERVEAAGSIAERTRVEARTNLARQDHTLYAGGRIVRERSAAGETLSNTQIVAGGSRKLLDGRLNLRLDGEFNLSGGGTGGSADFPHRARAGADFKVNEKIVLFLDQEFTVGGRDNTMTTRVGTKSKMWEGAESANSLNVRNTSDGPVVSASSTMTQTIKLSPTLTVTAGMDRTKTLKKPGTPAAVPVNANVPAAQGVGATAGAASQSVLPPVGLAPVAPVEDYTALFTGATWNEGPWGATARAEWRHGAGTDKVNLSANIHRDIKSGQAVAATALFSNTRGGAAGSQTMLDLRLSYAFRPVDSLWIVLSRLDYIQEESTATGGQRSRRLVANNNVNYQATRDTQVAFQYGAKYVFDTFDTTSASGLTQLFGAEVRHDIGNRFDVGAHGSVLHSHASNNMMQSYGLSVGFSPVTNVWLGLGYNFAGFRDRDFTSANATAKGWYLYLRMKADQEMREKDKTGQRQLMFEEATR